MIRGAVVVASVVLLSGCAASHQPPTVATTAPATTTTVRASQWPAPDNTLTPGGLTPGCTFPRPQSERNVPLSEKQQVEAAYHYHGPYGIKHLEIDHLIPFSLCGSNGPENLWPEIADGVTQSTYTHNHKDELEYAVYLAVRHHKLPLAAAQDIFRSDWRHAWCQWVHTPGVICDI